MGGRAQLLELLSGKDVNGDQVDLGVTVLASLGSGHVDDLARAVLDADETVLAQSRALHGVGGGSTGISLGLDLEGVVALYFLLVGVVAGAKKGSVEVS